MQLAITFLYILFVLSAIVLVVVILLQEGKGGGLTDALGTSGQATFGVGSSGINRFTGATAAVFLVSAISIHWLNRLERQASVIEQFGEPIGTAPADSVTAPPTGGGGDLPPPPPDGGGDDQPK